MTNCKEILQPPPKERDFESRLCLSCGHPLLSTVVQSAAEISLRQYRLILLSGDFLRAHGDRLLDAG